MGDYYETLHCVKSFLLDHQANGEVREALEYLEEAYTILDKAFDLYIDWTNDCDFGYDNIPDEYEKYRHELDVLESGYSNGLKYIAFKEAMKELKLDENS